MPKQYFSLHPNTTKTNPIKPDGTRPTFMEPVVQFVKDCWETPPADAFQFAYTQYLEWLLEPIEAMEAEREQKRAEFRDELQKIADLAPDLLARALTRNGLYARYFLKGDQDENE